MAKQLYKQLNNTVANLDNVFPTLVVSTDKCRETLCIISIISNTNNKFVFKV